jgi:hypothetical protein
MSATRTDSPLEETYRLALRWYPKAWRRRNEDAVLATLLDQAEDEKRSVPAKGELADLRATALLARLGPLGRIPASIRDRAAALALGLGAAIGGAGILASLYDTRWIPDAARSQVATLGPFAGDGVILYGLWILTLVVALFGLRRPTRVLLLAIIATSVVLVAVAPVVRMGWSPTLTTVALLAMLAVIALAGSPTRTLRGTLRTGVSAASWGATIGITLWYQHATKGGAAGSTDWFIGPLSQWMGFAIPFVLILAVALWRAARTPWAFAILIVEVPLAALATFGWQDLTVIGTELSIVVAAVLTAIGCLALLRGFGIRIRITRS